MKTTKIIIGCFVAITSSCSHVMLVAFLPSCAGQPPAGKHHGPTRTVDYQRGGRAPAAPPSCRWPPPVAAGAAAGTATWPCPRWSATTSTTTTTWRPPSRRDTAGNLPAAGQRGQGPARLNSIHEPLLFKSGAQGERARDADLKPGVGGAGGWECPPRGRGWGQTDLPTAPAPQGRLGQVAQGLTRVRDPRAALQL